MRIISNEKQRDNIAKYLYDISKICFAVAVIGPFTEPEVVNKITFGGGVIVTLIFFIFAMILDSKKTWK